MPLFRNRTRTPPSPCRVTATCHPSNSGALSENLGRGFPNCGAAYSGNWQARQRANCRNAAAIRAGPIQNAGFAPSGRHRPLARPCRSRPRTGPTWFADERPAGRSGSLHRPLGNRQPTLRQARRPALLPGTRSTNRRGCSASTTAYILCGNNSRVCSIIVLVIFFFSCHGSNRDLRADRRQPLRCAGFRPRRPAGSDVSILPFERHDAGLFRGLSWWHG